MDPNAALARMRELVREIDATDDVFVAGQLQADYIEHATGLDEWLSHRGYLPDAWDHERAASLDDFLADGAPGMEL